MTEFYVTLHSIQDVREFVSAASLTPVDIDVISGRYTIDAKSVLGLFSLDLEQPVLVRVYGSDDDGAFFRQGVEKLVVEPTMEP
jgi:phosphotransferase system HPr-like phosphotransfer protein